MRPFGIAGAGLSGTEFLPQITSYDYSAPLSEQGRKGQPGIGGPNKYEVDNSEPPNCHPWAAVSAH